VDCPFENLPENVQKLIASLRKSVAEISSVDDKVHTATILEKFYAGLEKITPFVNLAEKSIEDAGDWVIRELTRDDTWVIDMTMTLYDEALDAWEEAVRSQLCSGFGKALPPDYAPSQNDKAVMWDRAHNSAQSIADTFNRKLPGFVEDAKDEWLMTHGDFRGLNRYTLLKMVSTGPVVAYEDWHVDQVATTEFANQWALAVAAFWVPNMGTAELEYLLSPASASDPARDTEPICQGYAGRWLSRGDADMFPAHPNCVHYVSETRVKGGMLPMFAIIGLWGYSTETLPD